MTSSSLGRLWQACEALTGVTFPGRPGAHHDSGQLTRGDHGRVRSGARRRPEQVIGTRETGMVGIQDAGRRNVLLALPPGAASIAAYPIHPVLNHGPSRPWHGSPRQPATATSAGSAPQSARWAVHAAQTSPNVRMTSA